MNPRGLPAHLLFPFLIATLIGTVGLVWYLPRGAERFLIQRTAADLADQAELLVLSLPTTGTVRQVERICKTAYQSTGTRYTIYSETLQAIVDSLEGTRAPSELPRYPELSSALNGRSGTRIFMDPLIQDRVLAVAIAPNPVKGNRPVIRAAVSIAEIDAAVVRMRTGIMAILVVVAAAGIGWALRLARRLQDVCRSLDAGLSRLASGAPSPSISAIGITEVDRIINTLSRTAAGRNEWIQDVTRERNELQTVLSSMREGVFALSPDGTIISMNPAACRMFDCALEAPAGRSIQEVIRNLQLQRFVARAGSGDTTIEEDVTLYREGEVVLNLRCSPIRNAGGGHIGTLVVMADVTRLRQLERMRSDFAANVSHEIKTPLTAIKGFVETLYNRQVDSPKDIERFLGIIIKHVNRLDDIVSDLLSLSRIEQSRSRQELNLKPTRLRDVMTTVTQVLQAKAEEKEIIVDIRCDPSAVAVVDATLIEQAVLNLTDNAIKYSDPGGRIEITVRVETDVATIVVQDFGGGIAKRDLPRLFERFYRVDRARSRALGGTGLGLAIVKHITQAHGGKVWVDSTPGKGSTFTLQVPAS